MPVLATTLVSMDDGQGREGGTTRPLDFLT